MPQTPTRVAVACTPTYSRPHCTSHSVLTIPKDQEEREYAIQMFKDAKKDVLVGTDVASKGLDFPDIQVS